MENIFFASWENIIRITVTAILAYILLVFLLRVSGKRTLSKMNAFDFVVTVALGSTLASVILSKDVPLAEGILALSLLILLQYLITFLSTRFKFINKYVKSTPALLVYKGEMLHQAMLKERIADDEIYAVLREKGISELEEADAVILETDGTLTVIKNIKGLDTKVLSSVKTPDSLKYPAGK